MRHKKQEYFSRDYAYSDERAVLDAFSPVAEGNFAEKELDGKGSGEEQCSDEDSLRQCISDTCKDRRNQCDRKNPIEYFNGALHLLTNIPFV
jgi:hypothetical protein